MPQTPYMTRRRLLALLAASVAANAIAAPGKPETIKFDQNPFSLGVASGSPSSTGFVLWTRLMGRLDAYDTIPVRWEVYEDEVKGKPVATGTARAMADLAHSIHVEVDGLRPDRWYSYRFMVGDEVSPTGRTRTMPADDATGGSLRFAYASCQRWEHGYYAAYRHMLAESLDLVLFVGDYIYEYAGKNVKDPVRSHDLPEIRTLADYRARYALHRSDPDLQKMHAACPWLVTMDDHDVEDNHAGGVSVFGTKDFEAKRIAAYQAFYEHMPVRSASLIRGLEGLKRTGGLRIYQRINFGRLAAFHVLDNRQYRDAPLCGARPSRTMTAVCRKTDTKTSTMLGMEQERWLDDGLGQEARRKTEWNFLVQQTAFSPRNYGFGEGSHASTDAWDGFPSSRERLIASIVARRPRNPVFIGGDLHQNWVANVHQTPYDVKSRVIASDFCGTSITSRGVSVQRSRTVADANPHCLYANAAVRGYGVVQIDGERGTVRLRGVRNVADRDSAVDTLAEFTIKNGVPGTVRRS